MLANDNDAIPDETRSPGSGSWVGFRDPLTFVWVPCCARRFARWASAGESAIDRLVRVLQESILRSSTFGAHGALISASRILAARGEHEIAALGALQEQEGDIAWLPPLALVEFPPATWEHARTDAQHHTIYEVAGQAIEALEDLYTSSGRPRSAMPNPATVGGSGTSPRHEGSQ